MDLKNKQRSFISSLALTIFYFFCITNIAFANELFIKKDRTISYTDKGRGPALILIHAFPTDQRLWKPQQEKLQHYFRIITLDLWGFGNSGTTDGQAITMTEYADEVNQLMAKLHINKAIIGGESMGGYIALAFLQKYPNQLNGLILSDTQSIADTPETKDKREAAAVAVLQNGTGELIADFMTKALSPAAPENMKMALQNILSTQTPTAVASALRGMSLRDDTSTLLANTTLPILIMTGDQDVVISSQQSLDMHALAKNSKLVTITSAGHLSSLEQPSEWNQAVIDMFGKLKN